MPNTLSGSATSDEMHRTLPGEHGSDDGKDNLVYSSIKSMVAAQELAPGQRIRPEPLADRLFVSNTPVREALIRLAAERLINDVPKAGFFTKEVSEAETRDLYVLNQLLLDWSLSVIRRGGQGPGMLKPSNIFDTDSVLSPQSAVEMMDALFCHIARQSGNADAVHMVMNIGERTYYVRLRECELIAEVSEDLTQLCRLYHARDIETLRPALGRFHEKRLGLLPDVLRLIGQARLGSAAIPLEKTQPSRST